MSSDVMEFGFDDAKVVKPQGFEKFKQDRPNRVDRISIISFKTYLDGVISAKTKEKGSPLSDEEKADLATRLDRKLAEQLSKKVEDLAEVDRLDIRVPKFWMTMTHYQDGVGTIRCHGKWANNVCIEPAICCKKMPEPEQSIGTVVLQYPTTENHQVDVDDFSRKKHTGIYIYKLSSKKYKKIESVYIEARNLVLDGGETLKTIDVKVTLDGDPKYQKQNFESGAVAYWARRDVDAALRQWVLEQGLRAGKHVQKELGYDMTADKLAEKLGLGSSGGSATAGSLAASAAAPIAQDYSKLLE
ncbi:MAG TPA: hypothetical protein VIE65_21340 [Methylobacter sp.]